ncbi:Uncharacterized protein FWK35_00020588 [Aphis craccivora]|uniref:Uncharacterized protein n=1 Tax=Aphis craccivora TaxID=307492 RepID=A0A6G0YDJ2_APHCR|nr:Uncharacterized protein FWK35_00020588 [Aphis craccivora]
MIVKGTALPALAIAFISGSSRSFLTLIPPIIWVIKKVIKMWIIKSPPPWKNQRFIVLDSERGDECIDFTMLFFFFFFVEIMLQFQTLGVVSDSKMSLVGALESFQKHREKPKKKKKIKEKREFVSKTSFRPNRLFLYVVDT